MPTKKELDQEYKDIKKKLRLLEKEVNSNFDLITTSGKKLHQGCDQILNIFDKIIKKTNKIKKIK